MQDREVLTIDKIPVRLALRNLTTEDCLTYSARYYFSALGHHPKRHPLMHQIDDNPDCQALGICAESVPLALCFFHYRANSDGAEDVVIHSFMVAPYARNRGLGSLLGLHVLKTILASAPRKLTIDIEFPRPEGRFHLASPLLSGLASQKTITRTDSEIDDLLSAVEAEESELSKALLSGLIKHPDYRVQLNRQGCHVGAVSGENEFFNLMSAVNWPDYVAVQALHTGFISGLEEKAAQFDCLIVDAATVKAMPTLLPNLGQQRPGLPVFVVGNSANTDYPSVLLTVDGSGLLDAMLPHLQSFDPAQDPLQGQIAVSNLLHLPERENLSYFRNRHRSQRMFIAASGPSLADVDASLFEREIVVTINDALIKFPHARYASIMDSRKLHELHLELLEVEAVFTLAGNSYGVEINLLGTDGFSLDLDEGIYSGYTTAYFTLQIALYMGCQEIYFLGLDMGNTSTQSHFFGNRPMQDRDRPEVYAKMRQSFEQIAGRLTEMGIAVYNCSPVSELKCFPFRSVDEVLG